MKRLSHIGIAICIRVFFLAASLVVASCTLPSLENRNTSAACVDTGSTKLGRAISPGVTKHPGMSGIYPLQDSHYAFAARGLLAQAAERSLDAQYFLWHDDMSGTLMFEAVRKAADRGVRVRLLLDDDNTSGLDNILAALDAHPNIEVRLFNPFVIRSPRWIGYLTDFSRLNRRMHNKCFIVDNQVAVVGGRNVGDEYFGAKQDVIFADFEVMAVGPVVDEVSKNFDWYWASASSYPAKLILPPIDSSSLAQIRSAASLIERDPAAAIYVDVLRNSQFVREMIEGHLPLEWAATRMVSDDPAKGLGPSKRDELVLHKLRQIIGEPTKTVDLVSPYFIPTAGGTDMYVKWAQRGVKIRVLTNSLEATDMAVAHAGYANSRKSLLKAGITLYELRRLSPAAGKSLHHGSASALHAKTFSVDRSRIFVGSFNLDPRSVELDTEMGFIIDSPILAQNISAVFDNVIPANAYEARLSDTGDLYWIEWREGKMVRHDTEPGTSIWRRAWVWFVSILPVEWLL